MNAAIARCSREEDWSLAQPLSLRACAWSPHEPPAVCAQALWQEEALLFRLTSAQPPLRAEVRGDDGPVWQDSCLECFLSADGGPYLNLEANANGALLAAVGDSRRDRRPLAALPVPRPTVRCARCGEGWEAVFRVPAETLRTLLGLSLCRGKTLRVNFYACGDATAAPYYAAWQEPRTETPDFHRPESFGALLLA